MKHLSLFAFIFLSSSVSYAQSVAINGDASTAHPSAILDVKSTTKGMLVPRMTTQERIGIVAPMVGLLVFDNTTQSFWYYKTTGWTQLITTGSAVSYWNAQGTDIYNNNTGNVGIGTTTPATKLTLVTGINMNGWTHTGQVNGVDSIIVNEGIGGISASIGTFSNHAFRLNAGGQGRVSIYPAGQVVVGDNNSGSYGKFSVVTPNNSFGISHISNEGNILATNIGGTSAGIGTFSYTNMRLFANGVSCMLLSAATGNVGIGTDNPISKLTVQTTNNTYGISHLGEGGNILATQMGGTSAGIGTFSHTNMRLFANGVSCMFIAEATGFIGLGTDNPTHRLSVNGTIRCKEVIVENINWADYVFDKNYFLKPLKDVEKFIQLHKHLPNIPAASDIETKGLSIGETQRKMMEKIEELTLYLIEVNKKIEKLEQSVNIK